jgi:hypothetical protein
MYLVHAPINKKIPAVGLVRHHASACMPAGDLCVALRCLLGIARTHALAAW